MMHARLDKGRRTSLSSVWTWLLISCALFTIACVHLDHAFPFDLTQLYSTVNKKHNSGITLSTAQHYNDQQLSPQRRRRIKATTTSTTSTITTTTSTITTSSTTVSSSTQIMAVTVSSTSELPSPPYTLTEKPKKRTPSSGQEIPAVDKAKEIESAAILIKNHKQKKITPFPKQSDIFVETKYGKIKGMMGDVMGKDVSAFLGIPYARPPIRNLRFQKTVKPSLWSDVMSVITFKPHCVQEFRSDTLLARSLTTLIMSEDCLYMNIWSGDTNSTDLKPVIVWVYGGSFKGGTANIDETDGRVLAALGDVVIVTFNYRTGSLGFLDLLSVEAPGNQGLYDILQALEFVKENIASFGGDPDRVTLAGQDAGAVTAGLFMSSPKAKNLFQRAILQSGSPLFQDYFEGKNLKSSEIFAKEIDCASCTTLREKLKCLRGKTTDEILSVQKPLLKNVHHLFGPTFCDALLPDSASHSMEAEESMSVKEVIIGSNRDELSLSLVLDYPDLFNNRRINANITSLRELRSLILEIFSNRENGHDEESIQYLVDFFFTSGEQNGTTEDLVRRMYRVFGDAAVGCPVNIFAEQLVKKNVKVFLYEFNQRAQNMVWGAWMGVPIGTEVPYIFGHPLRYPRVYSKDDLAVSKRLIATWSQFARNGTVPEQLGQEWEPFSDSKPSFLEINPREAVYGSRTDNGVCNIFRIALSTRNESASDFDCNSKTTRYDDDIDLEDLYETTTVDASEMTDGTGSTAVPTEPPVATCTSFVDDPDGPSIDYYDYKVVDLKIVPVVGSKAVFYCDPDQEMVGEQISTCREGGVWSSEKPICRKALPGQPRNLTLIPHFFCDFFPDPLSDDRLRVQYDNLYEMNETMKFAVKGSLAIFKCFPMNTVDQVQLVGQQIVQCSKYGIWSSIEPTCQTVVQTKEILRRDFKQQFFLIGLILVITFALMVISFLLYSKMSIKEYTLRDLENQRNKKAHHVRRSLERLPMDGRREERELLQVNQEFTEGSEISPEDLEIISILSKARYGNQRQTGRVLRLDHNRNIIRGGSTGDDDSEESASSPDTVLWVQRP